MPDGYCWLYGILLSLNVYVKEESTGLRWQIEEAEARGLFDTIKEMSSKEVNNKAIDSII